MKARMAPVWALFFLSPFVGEFLLGNMTVEALGFAWVIVPFYGTGAILVRELGRRGHGWTSILPLAAAYALWEEGPVDQLLWNDNYAGADLLHDPTFIGWAGMSIALTQTILALHTIWSICVPIAIVESCTAPSGRDTPWLGRTGLMITGIVFALFSGIVFWGNYETGHFLASPGQFLAAAVAIVVLIVIAFVRWGRPSPLPGKPPAPWVLVLIALAVSSAYLGPLNLSDEFYWVSVAVWCVAVVGGIVAVSRWARRDGWGQRHRLALAAGAALTYVWIAFPSRPEAGGSLAVDLISNLVFAVIGVAVLLFAARRVHRMP